jgi:CTP synthase
MHLHAPHAPALHQGAGELKTKPTQHSVKELRSIGLAPDILVCRSEGPIPAKEREKLALFCNVRPDAVIAAQDLASIYEAPLAYHREGLDQAVLDAFQISPAPRPDLARWEDVADRINNPEGEVRVAIVGKYTQLEDAYKSIAEALTHGGMANRVKVKADWIDAEIFEREDPAPLPGGFRRHPRARRFRRAGNRGQDQGRRIRAHAEGALSGHLPRHADGGDRGGAEPRRSGRCRIGGIRP